MLGFYGRPQQGLNVGGSVSHSVSPSFTSLAVEAAVRRHRGMAGATNPPLDPSKRG